jgi:REP element-mobilizing transposase RayT
MSEDDRRLIEDYLPIQATSAEASREKSVRKGHISTLHLWWARRPLVACRAAVYGALVPANRFQPANGPEEKRGSLGRANAAKFVERLCKYPGDARVIAEAQQHILEAHAERLTQESRIENGGTGILPVTVEDILQGRAPRPKVLDMFAGGGAIPLEALRLGCEAYALDLNPVAHIIELCTLVYPQKYGKPDATTKGSAKDGTWAGLAEEVRYWGQWVLKKVKAEIGDLYPPIPDPSYQKPGGPGFQPGSARSQPGHSQLVQGDLFITRRNLPHWQVGGSTYFVTFRIVGPELPPEARKLVLDACQHFDGQRYALWAAVVMPDHVHLLLQPKEQEPGQWWLLSNILHSIKSFIANQINKLLKHEGNVWQDESFDRIVRNEEEFLEKWNYIRNNPVKRGLCPEPEAWDAFYERVEQASSLSQSTGKMPGPPRSMLGQVDGPNRFYVLWRYTYKAAELDAGEAIVFTYAQPVELDGQRGLSSGSRALVEKKKAKYRLRDFTERGREEKLGLPDAQAGTPAPLIDVLHRVLWLMENEPRALGKFLEETRPDRERLRLVAQALAGAGLKGKVDEGAKALVTTTAAE